MKEIHCEVMNSQFEVDYRRIWNRSQPDYCRLCCDEEKLETVEHALCNCPALSKLRLWILGSVFFEDLNSVSRADIQAIHRFISGLRWLRRARSSSLQSRTPLFVYFGLCKSSASHSPFSTSSPSFSYPLFYPCFLRTLYNSISGYCTCLSRQLHVL